MFSGHCNKTVSHPMNGVNWTATRLSQHYSLFPISPQDQRPQERIFSCCHPTGPHWHSSRLEMSSPSSITSSFIEWLKPPRTESLARLRTNSLGLFALTVLINLLPLPSFWTSISVVQGYTPANFLYWSLCATRMSLATLAREATNDVEK